jgi:cobyrinic acid a,c-diamide synthase
MECPRIIIAGTQSGVGKTTIALGLVAALKRRGLTVQTYKVGPDFLDPSYLARASGRPCYNLDGWMAGETYVKELFARTARTADIAIIEGVMGLFDGADPANQEGSTAEIARWLDAPVLLVVNAHGLAGSVAALVAGYADFDPRLHMIGIIANHCGSERHEAWLAASLNAASLPPLTGAIPRNALPELHSRHLGLVTADSRNLPEDVLGELASALERHVPLEGIVKMAGSAPALTMVIPDEKPLAQHYAIGVARDEAFHFYYQDLFDTLERSGCIVKFFSPVADARLPEGIDALYFGGGYPEEHAGALAANAEMIDAIRQFSETRRPIYAECGGLMYLCRSLEDNKGARHEMAGLIPADTRMLDRKKALGYVEITLNGDSLWGQEGTVLRGHEFHYSELAGNPAGDPAWQTVYSVKRRRSNESTKEGFQRGLILASYTHLHLPSRPEAIRYFLDRLEKTEGSSRTSGEAP